jgi:hypothetical protein
VTPASPSDVAYLLDHPAQASSKELQAMALAVADALRTSRREDRWIDSFVDELRTLETALEKFADC